jgi:peptide/nickel transport system ATP-binding protein
MERCLTTAPPAFDVGDGQEAACWLYAEDAATEREAAFGVQS